MAATKPKRVVSLLVAALVGAGLLLGGGVAGYFIGDASDGRGGRGGHPGHARPDFRGGGPDFGPGPGHGPRRGERRGPVAPPTTSQTPTTSAAPTTTA
ncbi:hypothetical protein [Alloactinosynnema sp. L-07]|nr:hypothetical protein [Alloactinosynnema sp. L-07]